MSRPTGTWNTSCYSTECALPDEQISGACLSVCLSVASCDAHRTAGIWLPTHTGLSLFLGSRGTFLERLWTAWSSALTGHANRHHM